MKQKKIIIGIILFLFISLALASSVNAISFSRTNINNVGDKVGDWFKGGLFKWYSMDTTGELKAEYGTQRKVVDFFLFFILFFSLALLGLKKVYSEGGNAVNALAFSIGALLSLALVAYTKVTLGLLFPFAKNILFFIILWVIYLVVVKIVGDDTTTKKLIALVIAAGIAWFAFGFVGADQGFNPFSMFDMTTSTEDQSNNIAELQSKLASSTGDEKIKIRAELIRGHYIQGKYYLEKMEYDKAQDSFIQVIELDANPRTNKYFDEALNMLREGIFSHMATNVLQIMEAKLYSGQEFVKVGMNTTAESLFREVISNGKVLQEEIKAQAERLERMREIDKELQKIQ